MTTTESTTRGTVDTEIPVTNLQDIRSRTATRAYGTAVPCPAVLADESATTRAEGVVFPLTLRNGRGVVDIGSTCLCLANGNCRNED